MLKAKLSNAEEISYKFIHDMHAMMTICRVYKGEQVLSTGEAFCHDKDQFNKTIGRKISLRRALQNANLSYADRQAVWSDVLTKQPQTFIPKVN